jgi:hypothetical protein
MIVVYLVKKFPAFHGSLSLITIFTGAHHWTLILSQMNQVLFKINFNISLRSTHNSPKLSIPPDFQTKCYTHFQSPHMCTTRPTHLILRLSLSYLVTNIGLQHQIPYYAMFTCYLRFQVLTAASMMFRIVFWDVLPCKIIVDRRF